MDTNVAIFVGILIGISLCGAGLLMFITIQGLKGNQEKIDDLRIADCNWVDADRPGEPISVDPVPKPARACDIIHGHIKRGGPIPKDTYYEC